MTTERPNNIAEYRKLKGLSQKELAEAVGAHWITISKLERGKIKLTQTWVEKIADALDAAPLDLVNWGDMSEFIAVNISGTIHDRGLTEPPGDVDFVEVDNGVSALRYNAWYKFEDNSGYPVFRSGDVVRFIDIEEEEIDRFVGFLCRISAIDESGGEFVAIGFLEKTEVGTKYTVRPLNGRPFHGVSVRGLMVAAEARFRAPWSK
jgi:transcriptional regulator with XRE-family HTH domain